MPKYYVQRVSVAHEAIHMPEDAIYPSKDKAVDRVYMYLLGDYIGRSDWSTIEGWISNNLYATPSNAVDVVNENVANLLIEFYNQAVQIVELVNELK